MILIPIKNFENSKQRLSALLNPEQRRLLAQTMLQDMLQALSKLPAGSLVALVTGDPEAQSLGQSYGFEIIEESNNHSETDAISLATEHCIARGIQSTLVIPGDVPLITADEVSTILASAPKQGTVLVPAADGRGTNAILRSPPNLFPARFGNDSFKPHLEQAQKAGKEVVVLNLPNLALDVDDREDLIAVLAAGNSTRTQQLLRSWDNVMQWQLAARA